MTEMTVFFHSIIYLLVIYIFLLKILLKKCISSKKKLSFLSFYLYPLEFKRKKTKKTVIKTDTKLTLKTDTKTVRAKVTRLVL